MSEPVSQQTYPLPPSAVAVLTAAQQEVTEARIEAERATTTLARTQARTAAFVTALAAALGIPEGLPVTVDLAQQQFVTAPVITSAEGS